MIEKKHNSHTVELYDSIEDLPITRNHKFNKYLMMDAGLGSDMDSVDKHIGELMVMNQKGDKAFVHNKLVNLRQNIYFIMQNVSPKMLAFAVLVKTIDGKEYNDISENGLQKVVDILGNKGFIFKSVVLWLDECKKKLTKRSRYTSVTSPTVQN